MPEAPDAHVLGRLLLVQSTLHVMPHTDGLGDLVCRGLSPVPGVEGVGLCLDGKLVGRSPELAPLPEAPAGDQACRDGGACPWQQRGRESIVSVQTSTRQYGCLVFVLGQAEHFAVYKPYVQNTANTIATTLENREQKARLESLNRDLRSQVADKERVEAALLEIKRGLEQAVADRTLDLVTLNETLEAEVHERKLAQETSAWEAALNGAVARLAQSMMQVVSPEEMASVVLDHALLLTDSSCGCVGYVDARSGQLVCPAVAGETWKSVPAASGSSEPDVEAPWGWVRRNRAPLLANRPGEDPRLPERLVRLQRFVSVPAMAGEDVVGLISLADAVRDYTDRDLELLQRLAEFYALAIQRQREADEHRRLAEQVQRSQKLESVGVLAGGVAHDFRNLLQIIRAYVDLLLRDSAEESPTRRFLRELAQAVERGADITGRLLAFSRKTEIKVRRIEANEVVKEVARLLDHTLPKMIRVDLHLAPDAGHVDADPSQLAQVLVNLAVNARDAMPQGGVLEMITEKTVPGREDAAARAALPQGRYVAVRVRDNGHGMDEETIRKAFDPFFTTKEAGQGTGLGLSVAYGIVKAHGGHIFCSSVPGRGSTFTLLLPAAAGALVQADEAAQAAPSCHGSGTVLVVDDEAAIVRALETLLGANGYRTLSAGNGEDALSIYRERGSGIDAVVMDLGMPGAGGEDCLRAIRRLDPKAKVIVSSGSVWPGWADAGAAACLTKPFPLSVLLTTLRQVLDPPQ